MSPTRVAAIDIGTNSVLLLIAEARGGELVPVIERATITRLGRGVDASRALAPDAVERTLACLASYAEEIRAAGVTCVDAVGTSAMRDARGGDELRERAHALLGVTPRVISGDEEAELTFAGALVGLDAGTRPDATIVFDLGGGSTEIIRGGEPRRAVSLDIGSVRLTERHVRSDPPTAAEIGAVRADARAALETARDVLAAPTERLVGVAGTVTTIAACAHSIAPYDPSRIHGALLTSAEVFGTLTTLGALTLAQRRLIPALDPARADVIVAGCIIVDELLAMAKVQPSHLVVSDRGVRWGIARRLASDSTRAVSAPY